MKEGSAKNRRLALQMANRPSVVAALRATNNQGVKQRLGNFRGKAKGRPFIRPNNVNVSSARGGGRIGTRVGARIGARVGARVGPRVGPRRPLNRMGFNNNNTVATVNRGALNTVKNRRGPNVRNRNANARNQNQNIGVRQTNRIGVRQNRGGKAFIGNRMGAQKKGFRNNKRNMGQGQNQGSGNRQNNNNRFRINRNFNALNNNNNPRQQQQQRRRNVRPMNKQQLDSDLDVYMARTKSHLDAELDAYMLQTS